MRQGRIRWTMCLIVFAYDCHPRYPLILAANRDEYFSRPTANARFWDSYPEILAGRDLEMLGTWMGITRLGRFAALTNFRDRSAQLTNPQSRGKLVSDYLSGNQSPVNYLQEVVLRRKFYNPFNLLVGDRANLFFLCSKTPEIKRIMPGIYGLSNHQLDYPWPKVQKSKQAFTNYLNISGKVEPQALFEILADREKAPDHQLPNTGFSYEFEKLLSSIFIQGVDYGTRSSTVLLIDRNQLVTFAEKTFIPGQKEASELSYVFALQ